MTQSSLKELTLGKEGDEFNAPKPNLSIKQHETHRRSYNRALKGVGGRGEKFGLCPSKPVSTQIYCLDLAFKM